MAFKTWEANNNDKFPMCFARTNIETMKSIGNGKAYVLWQTLSDELSTPTDLRCPADTLRTTATNFNIGLSDANISYFFSLDTLDDTHPQMILDGDDNLVVNGVRVKTGILNLPITDSLTWTKERHGGRGNIGMADGSVQQTTSITLNSAVIAAINGATVATYRWVIP
jgi:prepilin-type processing-associated H-X9-DG protein